MRFNKLVYIKHSEEGVTRKCHKMFTISIFKPTLSVVLILWHISESSRELGKIPMCAVAVGEVGKTSEFK